MALDLYDHGCGSILDATINLLTDDLRVLLATSGYTRNLSTDQYVSDIGGGNIIARSTSGLTGKTVSGRVFDADDATIPSAPTGVGTQVILYKYNASDSSARLSGNWNAGAGIPISTNTNDVTIQWSNGASKVFKILNAS